MKKTATNYLTVSFIKNHYDRFALGLFIVYFIIQTIFFALTIRENIIPDETTHYGLIQQYSKSVWSIENSESTYQYGLVTHKPNLYYLLMGKMLLLNFTGLSDLIFLRLLNSILGLLSILTAYGLFCHLVILKLCRIVFLAFITNTLMFTFLTSGVNRDNLTNLLAIVSLYFLVSIYKSQNDKHVLLFFITTCLCSLTKITLLPYVACLLAIFTFLYFKQVENHKSPKIKNILLNKKHLMLKILLLIFIIWNVKLFAGNLLMFGHLQPKMDQIVALNQAMKNRIFARTYILSQFKENKVTLQKAVQMAQKITHEGDRRATIFLLNNYNQNKQRGIKLIDRFRYAFVWLDHMAKTIFGVLGHMALFKKSTVPFNLMCSILLLALLLMIRNFKFIHLDNFAFLFACIILVYALMLMQLVNYKTYSSSTYLRLGLQGRYFFPVLFPFYMLISYYLLAFLKKPYNWLIGILAIMLWIYEAFPWFLLHAKNHWFFRS